MAGCLPTARYYAIRLKNNKPRNKSTLKKQSTWFYYRKQQLIVVNKARVHKQNTPEILLYLRVVTVQRRMTNTETRCDLSTTKAHISKV